MPGSRLGTRYSPESFEVRLRVIPLCVSMMVKAAPITTPWDWSRTLPRIRPVSVCAHSETENSNALRVVPSTYIVFLARGVFHDMDFIRPPFSKAKEKPPVGEGPATLRTG